MSDDHVLSGPGNQTRRALLAGAGAVGAALVLSACGGGDDSGGTTSAPTSGGPGATAGDAEGGDRRGAASIARAADIPVGGGAIYAAQGVVITQPKPGEFKGFSPICTHQNCPVSNIDGGTINCTCHGSRFSITDGSVKQGPATRPLPAKEIKVQGDQISLA